MGIARFLLVLSFVILLGTGAVAAGPAELTVVSAAPVPQSLGAAVDGSISVTFDRPVDPTTVLALDSFWAFGRWSGTVQGTFAFTNGGATVSLVPSVPLSAGERVMVILSHDLRGMDGSTLRSGGYSYQYWTAARSATLDFEEVDRFSTRTTPGVSTRSYGGIASDLDGDRFLDVTVVNEDTADLRVFLNGADGTGSFDSMLTPTAAVGNQASPSEPSDFDRAGQEDIAVANIADGTLSILLGNGDGTFGAQQLITVGGSPRGVAVLDADGDGDVDVAVTSSAAGTVSILLNDGTGNFGLPASFGTGGGEWALVAADMDEDGILDLAAGKRTAQQIDIYTGDGDGTFTAAGSQASGGSIWMLASGDVNGDGHEDLAAVNSSTNVGAILLGNGAGGLAAPVTSPTDPFPLAVDLGDLDGDGDLDWVTSSFSGDWFLFTNNGAGTFTFAQEFDAPRAASCSLLMDVDNDGDLDLALIDELEDEVIVLVNSSLLFADGFETGDVSSWDSSVPGVFPPALGTRELE